MNQREMEMLIEEQRLMLDLRDAQVKLLQRKVARLEQRYNPAVFSSNRIPAADLILPEYNEERNDHATLHQ